MTLLVLGLLFVLVAVPFAVTYTVRARRTGGTDAERAPEPRYGAEEPAQPRHTVGKAWARTTTHLD